jgi:ribonuclease P protein component
VPRASNQTVNPQTAGAVFPRSARLLRHADFERVYKLGQRHFSSSLTVFYLEQPGATAGTKVRATPGLRVGFTVGRALGGAVERNRIKRRLREAVRLSRVPLAVGADVVINPKKSLLKTDFEAVLNEVRRAFIVIEQRIAGRAADPTGKDSGGRKPGA